jgi:hypothetical protein
MKKHLSFKPAWWAFNTHIHTVIPSQFGEIKQVDVTRVEIETPDDDFLELDLLKIYDKAPVVALFHGLEGSSERFYIRNLMFDLQQAGFNGVAMNFRGCGSRLNRQPRFYHSGETGDYQILFDWIREKFPSSPIFAVGFSLGGNALLKSLGELEDAHPLEKAVAVSPPYELKLGSYNLHRGFNRFYEYQFLRTLSSKLAAKTKVYPEMPGFSGSSIFEFDDQVTAKLHGFRDAVDYYDSCSSKSFLGSIKRPLLIIHSKKDTLTPLKYAPLSVMEHNPFIETIFTEIGGHVGFVSSPKNWLNQTIVNWLKF